MGFGNIFDDPEVKRQILEDSGIKPVEEEYEIIEPETTEEKDLSNFQDIIQSAPKIPGGGIIKNIIKDASALVKDDNKAKEAEMNNALTEIFTQYNKEYGLDLQVDFSNFSRALVACSDERSRRVLEIYVSNLFKTIRPLLLTRMISKLAMAVEVLTDPSNLLNKNELSLTDLFLATSTILDYIGKLEELKESIVVDNSDLELKKIAEENNIDYQDQDEELVKNFMELFKKESLNKDQENGRDKN